MKRLPILAAMAAMFLVIPAHAAVTTSANAVQSYFVGGGYSHANGYTSVYLSVVTSATLNTVGTVPSPLTRLEATAYITDCDLAWVCTDGYFLNQTVNPLAFTMDPAGNSGTFKALLTPTSGSPRAFDVSITRPGGTSAGCQLTAVPCVNPNAWYDPTTSTAGADLFVYDGFQRSGYLTSGIFGGVSAAFSPQNSQSYYGFSIYENAAATAP